MAAQKSVTMRCRYCGAPAGHSARYCASCGRPLDRDEQAVDEVVVPPPRRLRTSADTVSLPELQTFVEQCVSWWQQRLQGGQVSREEALRSIEELRRALLSLSQQLADGRRTVRITSSLPVTRRFPLGCPRCGRGNRRQALYCYVCGWELSSTPSAARRPKPSLAIGVGLASHQGRVRPTNQDAARVEQIQLPGGRTALCCIVADGMGGANAGAEASTMACGTLVEELRRRIGRPPADDGGWRRMLRDVVVDTNQRIYNKSQSDPALRGMGTTLVMMLIVDHQAHLASVGDSRIYLANQRGVAEDHITWALLTVDHTLVARLVDLGVITTEQARSHPQRHVLYRALGVDPTVEVDTDTQPLQAGDRLLLCSDGLSGPVAGDELAALLMIGGSPQEIADRLVALANERGGEDNITALVLAVDGA